MNRKITLALAVLFSFMILAGCGKNKTDDRVIAEVGAASITKAQLDGRINYLTAIYEEQMGAKLDETADADLIARIKDQSYSNLILAILVEKDAEAQNIKADQTSIDATVNQLKTHLKNQNIAYADFLKQYNLTEAQYLYDLKIDNLMQQLYAKVSAEVTVDPEEERAYYEANVNTLFTQESGIQISHILVTDEALAETLIEQLNTGADFAALARENSIDGSAAEGGDLGTVNESTNFVPEFKTAALALQPGEYTKAPVKSQYGYHIIKAGEKTEAAIMPFEEVEPQIYTQLLSEKQNSVFEEYLSGLENNVEIVDKREAEDRGVQSETALPNQPDSTGSSEASAPK